MVNVSRLIVAPTFIFSGFVKAVDPLKVLDAITVADFKKQLEEAKEMIATSRNTLVNLAK